MMQTQAPELVGVDTDCSSTVITNDTDKRISRVQRKGGPELVFAPAYVNRKSRRILAARERATLRNPKFKQLQRQFAADLQRAQTKLEGEINDGKYDEYRHLEPVIALSYAQRFPGSPECGCWEGHLCGKHSGDQAGDRDDGNQS